MALHSAMMVESPSNMPLGRNLRAVPSMFDTPSPMKFRSSPLDLSNRSETHSLYRNENKPGVDGISHDFREALKTVSTETHGSSDKRQERIADAFKRGETLLLSNDNARPRSHKANASVNHLCRVTPTSDSDSFSQKSANHLHRYISYNNMHKIFGEVTSHSTVPDKKDNSNNAKNETEAIKNAFKKERKQRKRAKSTVKTKKSKHGRISIPSTGLPNHPDKNSTASSIHSSSKSNPTRQRVSSEPPSKLSLSSVLSCAPHSFNNSHTASQMYPSSACNNITRDLSSAPSVNSKPATGNCTQNVIHYTFGNAVPGKSACTSLPDALQAQGKPLTIHKTEQSNRVKSGHSVKSLPAPSEDVNSKDSVKDSPSLPQCEQLSLSAKPCNIHRTQKQTSSASSKRKESELLASDDHLSKEAALTAIYGAVYQTANRVAAQVEDLKKARKIFLSDKQSGTLKENGVEYPCAPPATPNPDLMRKYEYVPSMSDIRSQRAVKTRLQVMERDAQKKKEKQKEVQAKLEKQASKDRERILKATQRREIYALNKIMTELENKRFLEFCQAKGLNKV